MSFAIYSDWGEMYPKQKDSSSWGEPTTDPPVTVDNGTSAWGKPVDTSTGWDEPSRDKRETSSGWGSQNKSSKCLCKSVRVNYVNSEFKLGSGSSQ